MLRYFARNGKEKETWKKYTLLQKVFGKKCVATPTGQELHTFRVLPGSQSVQQNDTLQLKPKVEPQMYTLIRNKVGGTTTQRKSDVHLEIVYFAVRVFEKYIKCTFQINN
jgi:hypothetical protein